MMLFPNYLLPLFVGLLVVFIATSTIKIAKEHERGVVFRFGRLIPLKGPGLFFIFPFGVDRAFARLKRNIS